MSYITHEYLNTSDLKNIDSCDYENNYNRKIDVSRAKRYAIEFDENAMSEVVVSKRDGYYYIVDGQHTVFIAHLRGIDKIHCRVIHGLTVEEEAALFLKINKNRKPLAAYDKFKAAKIANDDATVRIVSVANMFGFDVVAAKGRNKIAAIGTVESLTRKHGIDVFANACEVLRAAWDGSEESLRREIVSGLMLLIATYPVEMNLSKLSEKLSRVSPNRILSEADGDPRKANKGTKVQAIMLKIYNSRTSKNRLA